MKKTIVILILLAGVCLMLYTGWQLIAIKQIYSEGDGIYSNLTDKVKQYTQNDAAPIQRQNNDTQTLSTENLSAQAEESPTDEADIETAETYIYIPDLGIDFNELEAINDDAVAWLHSPDTVIDYPVMKADDYSYYLYRLPDGTRNNNGSLFIDYNNSPDFSDRLTVIYGHNMKSKKMFGTLSEYKQQSYYDEHPHMYLYTKDENYMVELLYGCVIGESEWRERAFMHADNVEKLLAYASQNTTFISNAEYTESDKFIVLSTCSYEFDNARYVVIGILKRGTN